MTLEERLLALEDREAIRGLLIDYAAALDARDPAAYTELFADDGEWVVGDTIRRGREEIRALVTGIYKDTPAGFVNRESFELVFNPRVTVEGDRAWARSSHLVFRRGPGGNPLPTLFGRYEDEFVREAGKWKIKRRVDHPTIPTADEWGALMKARAALAG